MYNRKRSKPACSTSFIHIREKLMKKSTLLILAIIPLILDFAVALIVNSIEKNSFVTIGSVVLAILMISLLIYFYQSYEVRKKFCWIPITIILLFGSTSVFLFVKGNLFSSISEAWSEIFPSKETQNSEIETLWFKDNCIPSQWQVFNADYESHNGCLDFTSVGISSSVQNGIEIVHYGDKPIRLLLYRPIEDITSISFYLLINNLNESSIVYSSTDFFLGFSDHDTNILEARTLSEDHFELNGEYIIFSGYGDSSRNKGIIHQNSNTFNFYNKIEDDLYFEKTTLFKVDINISGNLWNIEIVNENNPSQKYSMNQLITKKGIFTIGIRIPIGGVIDLKLFDFVVE